MKCNKCNIYLENEIRYECKICNNIYCGLCFIYDKHIKNNIDNLLLYNNKCSIHKKELIIYCLDCKKNICLFCIKDGKNDTHEHHALKYLNKIIPSAYDIDEFNNKINNAKKIYEEYILLLDEWLYKIKYKINEYKENLRNKISLLEKMFFNINKNINNYIYYKNFNIFKNYEDI